MQQDGSIWQITMDDKKEEFPSIKEQGKSLAKFTFEVVKDSVTHLSTPSEVFANEELKEERMSICKKCEYYSIRQNRCKHCGCWLEHKVKFSSSQCPVHKW